MTQPLKLQLVITADGANAKAEIEKVRVAVGGLGAGVKVGDPFAPVTKGAKPAADATKLAAHEVQNLSFQVNDMAMMLASGQSPFVVMMQQGMQVSQIMGSRGLGSIIPAFGAGLASLVNPTMLALAGVTALGYGASAVFSRLGGDVATADEALAGHEEAIKALKDAWGEAGKGVEDYARQSLAVAAVGVRQSAAELAVALRDSSREVLAELGGRVSGRADIGPGNFRIKEQYQEFRAAVDAFNLSVAAGEPNVRALREEVARLANLDPENAELTRFAAELLKSTDEADRLARALAATDAAIDGTAAAADRAADRFAIYSDAMRRMIAGAAGELSELQKIERDYALAAGNASGREERDDAFAARQARLAALRAKQEGALVPVPTAAPNREEVLGEREARTAKAARAYEKLSGAIEEATARANLEAALIGASLELRNRAAAAIEAEREIRARNLDQMGEEAEGLRAEARALADLRTETAKSAEAWDFLKSSGESAIDGLVDKLGDGDIQGALEGLANDVKRWSLQMFVANPLKNFLFGGDNPTIGDLTQGGGLIGKLLGLKAPAEDAINAAVGQVAATMHVTAATVIVNGGIGGGLGGLGGGSGLGIQDIVGAGAANDNSVAGQVWKFFAGKGLKPHQIAGLMGNFAQESGFNPLAVGDGGTSFGLAQAHAGRAQALLAAIGGKGNLGDVGKQLDFIWKELQTSEKAAFERLLKSTNVREATAAVAGYERPRGWSLDNPENAHGFENRLTQAEAALAKYAGQTGQAGNAVATLGKDATTTASTLSEAAGGLDAAGKAMRAAAAAFPDAPGAPGGGGLLSRLFGGGNNFLDSLLNWWKAGNAVGIQHIVRGFAQGGYTGDGGRHDVAGLVHRGEYVFDAAATRAIGADNLEALRRGSLRGYEAGGHVGGHAGAADRFAANSNGASIVIHNYSGGEVRHERRQGSDGRMIDEIVVGRVGAALAEGRFDGAMGRYGAKPHKVRR